MTKEQQDELYYQLALTFVPSVGAKTSKALLERFGNATNVFKAPLKELKVIDGITEIRAKGFRDEEIFKRAAKEVEFVLKHDIQPIYYNHNYNTIIISRKIY